MPYNDRKILACDFDGTLCENAFPKIGDIKIDKETGYSIIDKVKELQKDGWYIILWTCRVNERLTDAVDWCAEQGLVFDAINANAPWIIEAFEGESRKIFAIVYLDDRALDVENF